MHVLVVSAKFAYGSNGQLMVFGVDRFCPAQAESHGNKPVKSAASKKALIGPRDTKSLAGFGGADTTDTATLQVRAPRGVPFWRVRACDADPWNT